MNLLSNALKFSKKDGVITIDVSLLDVDYIQISVKD